MRTGVLILMLALVPPVAAGADDPHVLLEQARHKQLVEGDLDAAIAIYRRIVAEHASNRAAAASALVQMGRAYEKLGKEQAKEAYARVVREYADQAAAASEARERLAALHRSAPAGPARLAARRVWHGPEVNSLGAPSADGRYLTATDWNTGNVIVRDLESGETRAVSGKKAWDSQEFAMFSVPSPDGTHVAYAWENPPRYELRVSRTDRSSSRTLATSVWLVPTAWTPDGKGILTLVTERGKNDEAVIFSAADGAARVVKTFANGLRAPMGMTFSPDGKFIAYDTGTDPLQRDIFLLSLADGSDRLLVESPANDFRPIWSPDGRQIFFVTDRGGSLALWSIPMDRGKAAGDPRLVKPDMGRFLPLGITRAGTLVYSVQVGSNDIYEAPIDAEQGTISGKPRLVTSRYTGSNSSPVWSPDGSSFCYISRRGLTLVGWANTTNVLVIRGPDGAERDIEPPELTWMGRPNWTRDGKSILVLGKPRASEIHVNNGIYAIDVETGAVRPLLLETESWINGMVLSSDGKTVYFVRQLADAAGFVLVRRDLATGEETILHRPENDGGLGGLGVNLAISPDDRLLVTKVWWVAGETLNAIRLVPTTPGGEPRDPLGSETVTNPSGAVLTLAFTRDGSSVLFGRRRANSGVVDLWRFPVEGGKPALMGLEMPNLRDISVSPDGRRILFAAGETSTEIWVMENLPGVPEGNSQTTRR